MPRSFNIDAKPALTEYVEHEFRLDRPLCGVDGILQFKNISLIGIQNPILISIDLPWLSRATD